jgi:hypothetical protein
MKHNIPQIINDTDIHCNAHTAASCNDGIGNSLDKTDGFTGQYIGSTV